MRPNNKKLFTIFGCLLIAVCSFLFLAKLKGNTTCKECFVPRKNDIRIPDTRQEQTQEKTDNENEENIDTRQEQTQEKLDNENKENNDTKQEQTQEKPDNENKKTNDTKQEQAQEKPDNENKENNDTRQEQTQEKLDNENKENNGTGQKQTQKKPDNENKENNDTKQEQTQEKPDNENKENNDTKQEQAQEKRDNANKNNNGTVHTPTETASFMRSKSFTYHNPNDTRSGKCLKNYFEDILLIIIYHFPFYESIPLLKSFYQDAFKSIVICGPETYADYHIMVVDIHNGHYGYECVGEAIRRHPEYRGYLYINDDVLVNWWTFYKLDKEKIWLGADIWLNTAHVMGEKAPSGWVWWSAWSNTAKTCEESYLEIIEKYRGSEKINITKLIATHLANGEGKKRCIKTWSDIFYVPKRFSDQFQRISFVFHKNQVFLEAAVPTILSFLDLRTSWEKHFGLYLPDKYGFRNFADGKLVWESYNYDVKFIHPVKFHGDIAKLNRDKLRDDLIPYSKRFTKC